MPVFRSGCVGYLVLDVGMRVHDPHRARSTLLRYTGVRTTLAVPACHEVPATRRERLRCVAAGRPPGLREPSVALRPESIIVKSR